MKLCTATVSFILLFASLGRAQKCGTPNYQEMLKKKFPSYKNSLVHLEKVFNIGKSLRISSDTSDRIYTIPVVVHIIYNSNSLSNIADDHVYSQIKVLNQDYRRANPDTVNTSDIFRPVAADTKFEFCLASRDPNGNITNGITRTFTNRASFTADSYKDDSLLKSLSRWPTDQYLNIWVTTLTDNVLGYTFIPGSSGLPSNLPDIDSTLDGVVVHYSVFGLTGNTKSKYALGRTATHEVGHWLALYHVWGDRECGDDLVDDTPVQFDSELNMDPKNCIRYSLCGADSTLDMSGNYMNYSPDPCMNIFSKGQKFRMRMVMETNRRRIAIQSSNGCCDHTSSPIPAAVDFESNDLDGWVITNATVDRGWTRISPGGFNNSSFGLGEMNNIQNKNTVDYLISPAIDLRNNNATFEFSLAYAFANNDTLTDSLAISYNSGCGMYLPLTSYSGRKLASKIKPNLMPVFDDWVTRQIDLKNLRGKIVRFRIENYSKGINNLYIDDIHIYDPEVSGPLMTILPNPAKDRFTAEIIFPGTYPILFQVFNLQGKLIKEYSSGDVTSSSQILIPGLASGIYFLKAIINNKSITKRFSVE